MAESLIFKAVESLCDDEDQLWVLADLIKAETMTYRELAISSKAYLPHEYHLRKAINKLLEKNLIRRRAQGLYEANFKAVLGKAMELLEEKEEQSAQFGD